MEASKKQTLTRAEGRPTSKQTNKAVNGNLQWWNESNEFNETSCWLISLFFFSIYTQILVQFPSKKTNRKNMCICVLFAFLLLGLQNNIIFWSSLLLVYYAYHYYTNHRNANVTIKWNFKNWIYHGINIKNVNKNSKSIRTKIWFILLTTTSNLTNFSLQNDDIPTINFRPLELREISRNCVTFVFLRFFDSWNKSFFRKETNYQSEGRSWRKFHHVKEHTSTRFLNFLKITSRKKFKE